MLAAYHGHADLVKFLLQHGADPNRLNDRGQSPLAGAVFKKEDDVIEVSRQEERVEKHSKARGRSHHDANLPPSVSRERTLKSSVLKCWVPVNAPSLTHR